VGVKDEFPPPLFRSHQGRGGFQKGG